MRKTYLITGGTGFIGTTFINKLAHESCHIIVLTRDMVRASKRLKGNVSIIESLDEIPSDQKIHVVVNLAGESIASGRWTKNKKEQLVTSRVSTTNKIINLCQRLEEKPELMISTSAIGAYGTHQTKKFSESDAQGDCFTSDLCLQWEQAAKAVEPLGIRLCIIRLGVVLGMGGALKKMLPPYKLGFGGPIGSGQQYFSWVHVDDVIKALEFFIAEESVNGVFNVVAPEPISNQTFSNVLGEVLNRPALFRMPSVIVKLLFGEMGEELLLKGQYVVSDKIQQAGFTFDFPDVKCALTDILK